MLKNHFLLCTVIITFAQKNLKAVCMAAQNICEVTYSIIENVLFRKIMQHWLMWFLFQDSCCWSAFKCFINETLLLKPADSQNEKLFNTTLSRIHSSQRNVQLLLCNSESNCDQVWFIFTIYFIINWLTVLDIFFLNPLYYKKKSFFEFKFNSCQYSFIDTSMKKGFPCFWLVCFWILDIHNNSKDASSHEITVNTWLLLICEYISKEFLIN